MFSEILINYPQLAFQMEPSTMVDSYMHCLPRVTQLNQNMCQVTLQFEYTESSWIMKPSWDSNNMVNNL